MILYTDNQADDATVSEAGATINYPAANVQDSRLSRIYKGGETCEFNLDAGGALKSISDAYTNLITDPTDLSTANWTKAGTTVTDSGDTILDETLWKLTSTTTALSYISGANFTGAVDNFVESVIVRYGNCDVVAIDVFLSAGGGYDDQTTITFSTKSVVSSAGATLLKSEWLDDLTVKITVLSGTLTVANHQMRLFISTSGSYSVGDFTYFTMPQITEGAVRYPFYDGAKSADVINETFTMPDKFTFDCIITPFFNYDTGTDKRILSWLVNASTKLFLAYRFESDDYYLWWQDGGTVKFLNAGSFDDGTSLVDINQRIRLIASLDLVSGSTTTSRLIVIPLESGAMSEDTTWSGTPDVKTSSFPTLSIGHYNSTLEANSEYEYIRIYAGLLVGTVTDSDDVTDLLEDKRLLLDKTYQYKITADALLLANTTINDGDTVTLRAGNYDSFNAGTPLDQSVTWTEDIIRQTFTKCSYQYWDLIVNSSNDIEIGRLFLGESYTTPDISPTITNDKVSAGVNSVSVSGQSYMDKRYFYEIINTTYPKVTHAEKAELFAMFEQIDYGVSFFVTFDETEIDLGTMYVTFDSREMRATLLANPNYYTVGITFREEI